MKLRANYTQEELNALIKQLQEAGVKYELSYGNFTVHMPIEDEIKLPTYTVPMKK